MDAPCGRPLVRFAEQDLELEIDGETSLLLTWQDPSWEDTQGDLTDCLR
jgi:hypothetical protein